MQLTLLSNPSARRLPRASGWRGRRYDRAMNTMMSAALPATALVHPIDPFGVVPRGLTATDGDRIAAAIAAARTESTRRVLRRRLESLGALGQLGL